jgi:pre-mRNA-processing factor 40
MYTQAVPEREREELFHEAQKEKAGREKEERRQEKKRRTSAFRELLERTPGIKVNVCCMCVCICM